MGSLYNKVKVNNPGHSFFNLSNDKKFDCDMGQLIPIKSVFCMPNDVIKYGNEVVARMTALVSPVMHEINIYTQYFFVPLRIMFGQMKSHTYPGPSGTVTVKEWDVNDRDFETFLTGGKTGYDTSVGLPFLDQSDYDTPITNDNGRIHQIISTLTGITNTLPTPITAGDKIPKGPYYYVSSNVLYRKVSDGNATESVNVYLPLYKNEQVAPYGPYSLWDYLEFPTRTVIPSTDTNISAFPFRAYALIWNNFFRNQSLMDEVDVITNRRVLNVCWAKDYFTAAYTELQRGQAPALPYSAVLPVFQSPDEGSLVPGGFALSLVSGTPVDSHRSTSSTDIYNYAGSSVTPSKTFPYQVNAAGMFNVNDLRVAFRVQEWLETNLRVGEHLNEFLIGHFGIGPNDETLQRPIYLGGSKSPVIVSEVLQTSETTDSSPQGNMAGHGITADRNYIGSYRCKEFGIFMGVMYIRPKATYQDGIDRQWLYETKYDFPFPEFAHLGNQSILMSEIFHQSGDDNSSGGIPNIFGYTERYNELRSSHSVVCGGLREQYSYWHLGRKFETEPAFNSDFVRCIPSKRIFASETEPGFIVNVGNVLHAYRPLPIFGDPRT